MGNHILESSTLLLSKYLNLNTSKRINIIYYNNYMLNKISS